MSNSSAYFKYYNVLCYLGIISYVEKGEVLSNRALAVVSITAKMVFIRLLVINYVHA